MKERLLTEKEKHVINLFEQARPGNGEIARRNILNPNSWWASYIEETPIEELVLGEVTYRSHLNGMYPRQF